MRVLHVIPGLDPRGGGPAVALLGLTRAQVAAGIEVSILYSWREQPQSAQTLNAFEQAGAKVEGIGPCRTPLVCRMGMGRAVDHAVAGVDVVHIHAMWESVLHHAARAAQRQAKPYLIRPCGMLDPWSLSQSRFRKALLLKWRVRANLNAATAIHCTSEPEKTAVEQLGVRAEAMVEPNGVELAEFEQLPPRGAFRMRYPAIGDRPMILFMSRVHPKKGLELLVPAFAKLAGDTRLVIAGPDYDGHQAKVEAEVRRLGLSSRVVFTGMLHGPQRVEALADADLFALPSHQENFGIAVIEALAAACPVVISDQVSIWRQITAARLGSAVPTRVEPLAAELQRWMADAELRRVAKEKARPYVWEHYDWRQIAQRWRGHYQRMTEQWAPGHEGT